MGLVPFPDTQKHFLCAKNHVRRKILSLFSLLSEQKTGKKVTTYLYTGNQNIS